MPKTVQSKVPYLRDKMFEHKYIFMALTETWLEDHKDAELMIEGYRLYRSDRVRKKKSNRGRHSGGVAFYIRDDLAMSMVCVLKFSNGVIEMLVMYSKKLNLALIVIYRQPNDSKGGNTSYSNEFCEAIEAAKQTLLKFDGQIPDIIMCGVFNLHAK